MALFKRKKKEEKKEIAKKEAPKKKEKMAFRVLKHALVTEKATNFQKGTYAFVVRDNSTKNEIKKAVKEVYNVDVESVRTITVPRKKKRLGRTQGWKKGFKKAIVRLKKGQEIEITPR